MAETRPTIRIEPPPGSNVGRRSRRNHEPGSRRASNRQETARGARTSRGAVVSTETNRPRCDRDSEEQPSGFTVPAVKLARGGDREAGHRRVGEETPGEAKPKGAAIRLLGPPCNRDTDFRGEQDPGAEPGRPRKRPTATSQRHVGTIGSRGSIPPRKGKASKGGTPSVRGVK